MNRFILTGAPGSGKTAILRQLEIEGFSVVEEAATDVIAIEQARGVAEPWKGARFIDSITELQRRRQIRKSFEAEDVQFHDRSVVCTAALSIYLGYRISETLRQEVERIRSESIFDRRVFFIQNLGFVTPSAARRISLEEALRFEQIHFEIYEGFGFEIMSIKQATVEERVAMIRGIVEAAAWC
jgi:predicted ATPase